MSSKQVKDYDKFVVRFPDGMRDAVSQRAINHNRSMNAEIIYSLSRVVNDKEEFVSLTPPDEIRKKVLEIASFRGTSIKNEIMNLIQDGFNQRYGPEKPKPPSVMLALMDLEAAQIANYLSKKENMSKVSIILKALDLVFASKKD